ncbi:MAG: choice-of-anchor D domain-containing protein [Microlunatus sp.]
MTSQSSRRAHGVYRVPYDSGIKVKVIGDDGSHFPPFRYDLKGTDRENGVYEIVAAAAGIVRRLVDNFNQNRPDGNPCNNNYVWLEHPNGEWTKYTHLRQGSATAAGLVRDRQVAAGARLGIEGDVGCAHGQHLHFEVAIPDPNLRDPIDSDGFIIPDHRRNRIPWICGIEGRQFVDGRTVTARAHPSTDIAVLPDPVVFAKVPIGHGETKICTVVNLGQSAVTIAVSGSPGGSVLAWFPVRATRLAPGDFIDIPIRFTPASVLPARESMTLTANGERTRVSISGIGTGSGPWPAIVAVPGSLAFGSVAVDGRATKPVTITNRGPGRATINTPRTPSGSVFHRFALKTTLEAGESVGMPIRFRPTGVGPRRDTLEVTVAGGSPVTVPLLGHGAPLIEFEPAELDFKGLRLGDTETKTISIVNPSTDDPVSVTVASGSTDGFRWPAVSAVIPAEGRRTVTVTFAPLRRGPLSATLLATVAGSSPYTRRLRIVGTGTGGPHVP